MQEIEAKGFEAVTAFTLLRDHNGDVAKANQAADDVLHLEAVEGFGLERGDVIKLLIKNNWDRTAALAERQADIKAANKALQDKARLQHDKVRIKEITRVSPDSARRTAMAELHTKLATMLQALAIWRNGWPKPAMSY